jgi:hypothetical protein
MLRGQFRVTLTAGMCAQCMVVAAAVMGTASGTRSWIASRLGERLDATAMRAITVGLLVIGVLLSGLIVGDTGA